jgi:hypothetical protein
MEGEAKHNFDRATPPALKDLAHHPVANKATTSVEAGIF